MRLPGSPYHLSRPGHRVATVFVVFVLLPGVVLGVFALRTSRQELVLAQQQIRQRLQNLADRTGVDLAQEFRSCQDALATVPTNETAASGALPEVVREAVAAPGAGVVVWQGGQYFESLPPGQLLYLPPAVQVSGIQQRKLPASVAGAETLELAQEDYPEAIRLYRRLLISADAESRPVLLHRLARTFRKAGRLDDAARAYEELGQSYAEEAGAPPPSLIARSELCSIAAERGKDDELAANVMAFYHDLVRGRWLLEKPRYLYYVERCRSWSEEAMGVADMADEFKRLEGMEEQKLALTRAVEQLLSEPKSVVRVGTHAYLVFWQREPFAAVVLSRGFLESHWWPRMIALTAGQDLAAGLQSPDGKVLFGDTPQRTEILAVSHNVKVGDAQWHLQVWPLHPAALYSDLNQRQNLYIGMLVFVLAFLVFGSYITARTVRRELEIARMRADFVSIVSHEFRSPLTGIRQLGEMLLDGRVKGEERQRRYYQMIVHESERLGRLVENTLDFSRMEEGRKEYRFAPLGTSVWLQEVAQDFQSEVAGSGVSVTVSIAEGLPEISADREALTCAVHNLLDNAVKYSPGSETVWLDGCAEDGGVRISVRDSGIGIREQDRRHVFEKFYRVDGRFSQRVKGAGLGLSLVKHIVKAHGGMVECMSREGEGSTFSIRLPAAKATAGG